MELDKATVKIYPNKRRVEEFDCLVGQHHMEDGFLCKNTLIVIRRGLIISYRSLITEGMQMIEDKTPIYVADLHSMTKELSQRLHKKSVSYDGDIRDVGSQVANTVLTQPKGGPEPSSGKRASPDAQPESGQRRLTNMSALGEIHMLGEDVGPYLREADVVWLSAYVRYKEPQTYAELLRCP